jgi:hypothetical protein
MTEEQADLLIALIKQLVINHQRPLGVKGFTCECGMDTFILRNEKQSVLKCAFCGNQEMNPAKI